jgi:glutathione S-transferase
VDHSDLVQSTLIGGARPGEEFVNNVSAKIKISAFRWVPPFAQGLVRDLRVRWALEEAGLAYEERLIGPEDQQSEFYLNLQPFGQVPSYEEDGLVLFESGAIVLHIAERSDNLMPSDSDARQRTKAWMFAALNTIEPPITFLKVLDRQKVADESAKTLRPALIAWIQKRLTSLQRELDGREYLVDRFTAADLLMVTVLRILRDSAMVEELPALDAYRLRGESRPAFQRALAAQMARFAENAPPSRQ